MFNFFKKKEKLNLSEDTKSDFDNRDNKTDFEESLIDANNGNIPAATHVGISYHYGIDKGEEEHPAGIEPNSKLAIKYLIIAAERGYLKAQVDLGLLYYDSNSDVFDKEEGFRWLSVAAKRGDSFSQFVLAVHYRDGIFLPKDDSKAFNWFLESASNGEIVSMNILGDIYRKKAFEISEREDFEEHKDEAWMNAELSFKWYKLAADNGDEEAMYYTGVNYFSGFGVVEDKEKSLIYIDLAIENGVSYANDFKQEKLM